MVRLGVSLSIVALAALQLPWVRCAAGRHDALHLNFEECPHDGPHQDVPAHGHEDADHESSCWDVAGPGARSLQGGQIVLAAAAPPAPARVDASAVAAPARPPLPDPLSDRSTVLLL